MKTYLNYKTTYAQPYRGYPIHCCLYHPGILCHVGQHQHGCFWINTDSALVSAKEYIDRMISEQDEAESKQEFDTFRRAREQ